MASYKKAEAPLRVVKFRKTVKVRMTKKAVMVRPSNHGALG
jgi:hypothetical protein